ncbi:MAG: hypothetical protein ABR592_03785 [Nitriliruptorales bacterium]
MGTSGAAAPPSPGSAPTGRTNSAKPSGSDQLPIAQVLVEVEPDHLDRPFDYALPEALAPRIRVGSRVEVVFAGRRVRGLVVALTQDTSSHKLREVRRVLGPHAWATPEEIEVLRWAAQRFAAPTAAVIRHALPQRVSDVERRAEEAGWYPPGRAARPPDPEPVAIDDSAWSPYGHAGSELRVAAEAGAGAFYWRTLPHENLGVRLVELAAATLDGGRDVLVVVPEPKSCAADAVTHAFRDLAVDMRGGPGARRLYRGWLEARCGQLRVVVGERGVAFWPLARLGLAVIIDEANPALKERRAPRHHAREVVLERARRAGATAVLVGTVPSAAAWRLLAERRLRPVVPDRSAERSAAPIVRLDDRSLSGSPGRLGTPAVEALRSCLKRGELGVVLAARRGEGRALLCSRCSERFACPRCDSSLAVASGWVSGLGLPEGGPQARRAGRAETAGGTGRDLAVLCEGCGWTTEREHMRCGRCGGDVFAPLAAGAARLGSELARTFRNTVVAVLEGYAQPAPPPPAIVVMTRGSALSEPPGPVGAVVLPDLDGQLRRPTLDAGEDALRLAFRVAAWPSRSAGVKRPGSATRGALVPDGAVVVQTREPGHHAVRALVAWDPGAFWREEARRRGELRFPPAAYAIRLDVHGDGRRVAADLRSGLPGSDQVLGPRPLGERSGLLVKSADRSSTLAALTPLRVVWSREGLDVRVDVDPVDVG